MIKTCLLEVIKWCHLSYLINANKADEISTNNASGILEF